MAAVVGSTVPDYRGLFLRGVGGNSAAIGVQQNDAIRNIKGETEHIITGYIDRFISPSSVFKTKYLYPPYLVPHGSQPLHAWSQQSFDASRVVPTASENRPVNKAVRYLIRALE